MQATAMQAPLAPELVVLGWSVLLLALLIALQSQLASLERGLGWNAGPRDGPPEPLGPRAGRAERALKNFLETYPAFIGLALALAVSGRSGGMGATGAWLWLGARIAHVPLYIFGVAYVRSLAWTLSAAGLGLMLIRLL